MKRQDFDIFEFGCMLIAILFFGGLIFVGFVGNSMYYYEHEVVVDKKIKAAPGKIVALNYFSNCFDIAIKRIGNKNTDKKSGYVFAASCDPEVVNLQSYDLEKAYNMLGNADAAHFQIVSVGQGVTEYKKGDEIFCDTKCREKYFLQFSNTKFKNREHPVLPDIQRDKHYSPLKLISKSWQDIDYTIGNDGAIYVEISPEDLAK